MQNKGNSIANAQELCFLLHEAFEMTDENQENSWQLQC